MGIGQKRLIILFITIIVNVHIISMSSATTEQLSISDHVSSLSPVPTHGGIKGAYWLAGRAAKFPPAEIDTKYFTHVFYAFLLPNATSFRLIITARDVQWMRNFTSTLHEKWPPVKTIMSLGGGDFGPDVFSNMASNSDNRYAFIKSTIDVARKYGFDGIDLDWEFPQTPQDMSNLALLLREWRTATEVESCVIGKPRLLLTAVTYYAASDFSTFSDIPRTYPGDAITKYLDFTCPMSYDLKWGILNATGAHEALLFDKYSNISVSHGISTWLKNNVPPHHIVMGLSAYGRKSQLLDPNNHGIRAPTAELDNVTYGFITYEDVVDFNVASNATVVFDYETLSTYSYSGFDWIAFDDPRSIAEKVKFARGKGLGGYLFWALGYDKDWALARAASKAWDEC